MTLESENSQSSKGDSPIVVHNAVDGVTASLLFAAGFFLAVGLAPRNRTLQT
jgi:hypothetical protein